MIELGHEPLAPDIESPNLDGVVVEISSVAEQHLTEKERALQYYRQIRELERQGMRPVVIETVDESLDWMRLGSCEPTQEDLFFPERGASTREAKEICRLCIVREPCLEYAIENSQKFGIWGGMSERERRRIRRQRAQQRAKNAQDLDQTA